MNNKFLMGAIMLCSIFFSTSMLAQKKEWKNVKTKDGKISAKYSISTRTNEEGEEVPLIESTTNTIEKISINKCITLMKDVSKHKDFHADNESKVIKNIAENKWVVYYYTEGTLFTPDADGVYTMTFTEDPMAKTAVFTIAASPTLLEKKDVKRVTYMNEVFSFKDLGNGTVQITSSSKMSPAFKVPGWVMKMAFPDILFDVMQRFIKLAHDE